MKLAQSKESKRQKQLKAAFLQKLHSFSCDLCVTLMSLTGKLPILELGTGTIHHEKTDDKKKKKGVHETPKLPRSVVYSRGLKRKRVFGSFLSLNMR